MNSINGKTWFTIPTGTVLEERDDETGVVRSYVSAMPLTVFVEDKEIQLEEIEMEPQREDLYTMMTGEDFFDMTSGESKHPSHDTRFSDASTYDEVCVNCRATDRVPGGWGELAKPCPAVEQETFHQLVAEIREERFLTGDKLDAWNERVRRILSAG